MSAPPATAAADDRVIVLALTHRDELTMTSLLTGAGFAVSSCRDVEEARRLISEGGALLVIPEELITAATRPLLLDTLEHQPPWSDLPVLLLTRLGAASPVSIDAGATLGNVTLLERPLRQATFLSAVRSAMRARKRQYEIRAYLAAQALTEETLRQADQRKDEFLATLGHELRNPLAPLVSGLHLMRLLPGGDPRLARVTGSMERQIAHLVRLVDDLLEVSRITRGLIDVRHDPLDLAAVLQAAVETTRPVFDAARHNLQTTLPEGPLPVAGDAVRLTQVFANLLTNAAKYTNSGGTIVLTAARVGDRVIVSVRDNGIGIPASHLGSVFDMFTQVDRSSRRAQGGLGIGLTLVRSLVALHDGRVEARSAGIGTGSEFIVELPVLNEAPAEAPASAECPHLPHHRILVVDDNRDAAETLGALLEALGATVCVADSGLAALTQLGEFHPDTVLLDIGLPGMDGYEVARHIRERPAGAGLLLIALTGWGQEHDYELSRLAGIDHHMVKPPDIDKLCGIIGARA